MVVTTFLNRWPKRKEHFLFLWGLYSGDFIRFVHWNFRGGKEFYNKSYKEIIKAHKWCFIVGCNNSGTSLLHSLLNQTGLISTPRREGQYYSNVLTRGNRKGYERVWTEFLDEVIMDESSSQACVSRLLHDLISSVKLPVKELFVDKTTLNAVRMRWLQEVFPNSYFIGVVRNGYAVVEGIKRKGCKTIRRGAQHWNSANKIMITDSKKIEKFLLLKYEDLVNEQEETANKLSNFLGINKTPLLNAFNTKFKFETLSGRNLQSIKNFNMDSIAMLSNEELDLIRSIAGEMLDYFDYSA